MMKQYSKYSRKNVLVIWFLLGLVGGHRFYTRKYITGILYLFTIGFCGLGYLYDGYLILTNEFSDKSGLQIKPGKKIEKLYSDTFLITKIMQRCSESFMISKLSIGH